LLAAGKFIDRSDVTDMTLSSFTLVIRQSKTIQFGQRQLTLPYVASHDVRPCPIRATLRHFGCSKLPGSDPLFDFVQSGVHMPFSHAFFIKRLKSGLQQTGNKSSSISCHSFLWGGATLAFSVDMSAIDIKLHGDWKSNAFEKNTLWCLQNCLLILLLPLLLVRQIFL
jgi:hypothetical protein